MLNPQQGIDKENIDLAIKTSFVKSERCVCDIILPSHFNIIMILNLCVVEHTSVAITIISTHKEIGRACD